MPKQGRWLDKEAKIGDLNFHYLDWGTAGHKPMLLLHGGGQDAHSWDEFSEVMRDRYHVYALDQRGHGDSDWSPDGEYRREDHLQDITGWVEHLGVGKFILIGLSMGGVNSLYYTLEHPDAVDGLVLVDIALGAVTPERQNRPPFDPGAEAKDSLEDFVEAAHRFNPLRPIEQLRDRLSRRVKQRPDGKWVWKFDTRRRMDPEHPMLKVDPEERLAAYRKVQGPTLLVRGAQSDVVAPEVAVQVREAIPDCTLATVEKAGHTVPGDNPRGFYEAVRAWLDSEKL